MKISYSPYTLKPAQHLNATSTMGERSGVLLKIEWPDGLVGYSDLHPWVEFGDEPWEDQLAGIRQGQISTMLEQSIWMARKDAQLRKQDKNAFEGLASIKNNYLVSDLRTEPEDLAGRLKADGFETVKIKVGRDLKHEAEVISALGRDGAFKLRLDFNAVGTWQTYERFMSSIDKVALTRVQYVEDPFPFDPQAWMEAKKFAPIAVDNEISKVNLKKMGPKPFDVVILKPAKMDVNSTLQNCIINDLKVTVTSYMDHPVGVIHALAIATELKKAHPQRILDTGCMTLRLFQMDLYAAEVISSGAFLKRPAGRGIGFDTLLAKEPWTQVKIR
ncbi:enolase C-terminal domain-like protein [Bdellovibrio sp. HCB337]|uniref:enolase C-terminal domain-like protein n=1 Tax=Bdellovibrio sp. HCB337 TaxID=3394358 RepID=UPI0039A6E31A